MYLTRQQYDWLVTNCPGWMAIRWNEYRKRWCIGGVYVEAESWRIENLAAQLQ